MRPMFQMLALATSAAVLTGCSLMPPSSGHSKNGTSGKPRPQQMCNADAAQWAIGKTNTEHNVNEARKRSGAYMARVLRPGQPTTREFNAERLNLETDATGRITRAFCG